MEFATDTVFAAPPDGRPLVHRFETEAVVFNPVSADTHLLSLPTVAVLEAILASRRTCQEITDEFLASVGEELSGSEVDVYLGDALRQLASLDLIQVTQG
jgi:PqqD family protein of HPr-rel-A system